MLKFVPLNLLLSNKTISVHFKTIDGTTADVPRRGAGVFLSTPFDPETVGGRGRRPRSPLRHAARGNHREFWNKVVATTPSI